jgi:RNA polymerase sigma-70 factor (ECF subfamily)
MLSKIEFRQLFDKYFDTIRNFIFYRCGNADLASDITQDVFMKVWEKREMLRDDNMKSLLYKMANDLVISNYRKSNTRLEFEQNMIIKDDTPLSPEEELAFKELTSSYAKALEKMPEAQRIVFLMSRNDELKYNEIATHLNISVKTVEKQMSAALQYLRTKLL